MPSGAPVWPDDDQRDLAEAVRTLLARRADSAAVRAAIASDAGFDDGLWWTMAGELGVAGLAVGPEHGGSGAGVGELAVVAQELGRVVAPSPWFATVLAAAVLGEAVTGQAGLGEAGPGEAGPGEAADPTAAEVLAAIATGRRRATVALPLDGTDPADQQVPHGALSPDALAAAGEWPERPAQLSPR